MISASVRHLWSDAPDFIASLTSLERYDRLSRADDAIAGWLELMWGATLVGLRRPDAIAHLTRTVRLADRLGVFAPHDQALRLVAIAAAQAGHEVEAAMLVGYGNAHLHTFARDSSAYFVWHVATIDEALARAGQPRRTRGGGRRIVARPDPYARKTPRRHHRSVIIGDPGRNIIPSAPFRAR